MKHVKVTKSRFTNTFQPHEPVNTDHYLQGMVTHAQCKRAHLHLYFLYLSPLTPVLVHRRFWSVRRCSFPFCSSTSEPEATTLTNPSSTFLNFSIFPLPNELKISTRIGVSWPEWKFWLNVTLSRLTSLASVSSTVKLKISPLLTSQGYCKNQLIYHLLKYFADCKYDMLIFIGFIPLVYTPLLTRQSYYCISMPSPHHTWTFARVLKWSTNKLR